MIQANEIKVNNVFTRELRTSRGQEFEHDFVLTEYWMSQLFSSDTDFALQDLFGIPLTPEILTACGFMQIDIPKKREFFFQKFTIRFEDTTLYNPTGIPCFYIHTGESFSFLISIKSLHQLQNLYYSLTGTELIYQPKQSIEQ